MALTANPDARSYYLPAVDRLEDADILLANGRAGGCIYLAGFAVECLFKALVLVNSTPRQRPALVAKLKTVLGHDLDGLRKELERRGLNLGPDEREAFRRLNLWDNNIRYDARLQSSRDAAAMLAAARVVFAWADRAGGTK